MLGNLKEVPNWFARLTWISELHEEVADDIECKADFHDVVQVYDKEYGRFTKTREVGCKQSR